jgi:hypothetical protein
MELVCLRSNRSNGNGPGHPAKIDERPRTDAPLAVGSFHVHYEDDGEISEMRISACSFPAMRNACGSRCRRSDINQAF